MDQKLYLSAYMDLYSSEIMSYSISSHPTLDMAINPLKELLNKCPNVNYRLIIHSDQGWHYQNAKYVNILKENKVFQSMSRKGNCLDNSVMENFFGLLKQEMFMEKNLIIFINWSKLFKTILFFIMMKELNQN